MAAPAEVTITNLSGKYTMNKTLSDPQDPFLTLQGIGWLTRKAINMSTITLELKQYEQDGTVHIDITTHAGSLSTTQEDRVLNWVERGHQDKVFGNVKGKSRLTKKAEFQCALDGVTEQEKKYLLAETLKDGSPTEFQGDDLVQSVAFNQDGLDWGVDQVWGFETINGERRYTRRLCCKRKGKTELMRLVYDYNGPL